MTTQLSFAIEPGHDVTAPTNFEDIATDLFAHILPDQPVALTPLLKRRTLNNAIQANGKVTHVLTIDVCTRASFNALILHIFGDFLTDSAEVTLISIDETGNYGGFNATVSKPVAGQDYEISEGGFIRNLRLTFFDTQVNGGFSVGFSLGFRV